MSEPLLLQSEITKDADTAAQRAAATEIDQQDQNPYPAHTDAGALWHRWYCRQLLLHSRRAQGVCV